MFFLRHTVHLIHMLVFEAFLPVYNFTKNGRLSCDTRSVSRAYTYSNHVALVLGKKSWPWPWQGQGQGQDFSLKAKTWGAKTLIMRCPRGSSRQRPGLEDNKTGHNYIHCVSKKFNLFIFVITQSNVDQGWRNLGILERGFRFLRGF